MNCPYCGSPVKQGTTFCGNCGAAVGAPTSIDQALSGAAGTEPAAVYGNMPEYGSMEAYPQVDYIPVELPQSPRTQNAPSGRRRPHIALRIPLQILSLLLSLVLAVSLLATALVLDVNRLLSAGGIKQLVNALFSVSQADVPGPAVGAVGGNVRLDDPQIDMDSVEIPADVLTSGDTEALVEWMLAIIEESVGTEVDVDEEQLQEFVEQSTLTDYMAEKAAGYAEDFINGTKNTIITSEELMKLVEENEELIASTFQVDLTPEIKDELQVALQQSIEDSNLNEVIHEQVFETMQQTISETLPVEWATIQSALQTLTSNTVIFGTMAVCVVLMLLLCALNFYNIPGGMAWSAFSCILAGGILSLPLVLVQSAPGLLTDLTGMPTAYVQIIVSFSSVFTLVHYGVLALGVGLLVLSIVLAIIIAATRQKNSVSAF